MMTYRGSITIDFTSPDGNEYNKLSVALVQLGWLRVETSLFIIDTSDLSRIWVGIELVARQQLSVGVLSALTFQIHGSDDWNGISISSAANHPKAMEQILAKPLPNPI